MPGRVVFQGEKRNSAETGATGGSWRPKLAVRSSNGPRAVKAVRLLRLLRVVQATADTNQQCIYRDGRAVVVTTHASSVNPVSDNGSTEVCDDKSRR